MPPSWGTTAAGALDKSVAGKISVKLPLSLDRGVEQMSSSPDFLSSTHESHTSTSMRHLPQGRIIYTADSTWITPKRHWDTVQLFPACTTEKVHDIPTAGWCRRFKQLIDNNDYTTRPYKHIMYTKINITALCVHFA